MNDLDTSCLMGTLFSNCMAKHGEKKGNLEWLYDIKNGKYKDPVTEIRELEAKGDTALASEKKKLLPAIVPAGFLPEGRTEADPIVLSYVVMIDYDNHNHVWSAAARDSLKGEKGVLGAYETIRYGLRVLVYLPKFERSDYAFFANVVFDYFDKKLGYKHDPQVKTVTHLCSASYDPDAWFVNRNEITEFPVIEQLERIQHEAYQVADGKSQVINACGEETSLEQEIAEAYNSISQKERQEFTKVRMDYIMTKFIGRCSLEDGSRNNNLVRFGQYLHFMRCNVNELDYFIKASVRLINSPEYNEKRVRQCICWGYMHNDRQVAISKKAKQDEDGTQYDEDDRNSQNSHSHHYIVQNSEDSSEYADFQNEFYKIVKESCPLIPDTVYEHIPEFYKPLIFHTSNPRDTDISFISALAATSAAMPNVTVQVRQKNYSTNSYFCFIGPAGSGKGMATLAPSLLDGIQQRMNQLNDRLYEDYERREVIWQLEVKQASKEQRLPNWDLKPKDIPFEMTLKSEPQTSRSKLILDLAFNPDGLFMFAPELNTINESLHSDCGHHSAELAGIAMNEKQGLSYKNTRKKVTADFPKLTILATGTPSQYVSFIGNTHAGMESRVHTLLTTSDNEWLSWGDEEEGTISDIQERYHDASEKLANMFDYLKKFPTHVTIPAALRYKCDNYCRYYLKRLIEEGYGDLDSIVKRCPILISRICGIFCAMRKYDMGLTCVEMEASEEDVETALKIAITFLRHTCIATTMLVDDSRKTNNPKNVFQRDELYNMLGKEFSINDVTTYSVKNFKYSEATIFRILKQWTIDGYIEKVRRGYYVKTSKKRM